MPDTAWKAFERRVAAALGGTRAGPLGASLSDIDGTPFSVECKRTGRETGGIRGSWISQARRQGKHESRPWILVVAQHGDRAPVVVLDFATFVGIARDAGLVPEKIETETYRTNFGREKEVPS
jgi:hypothetical protein